jgi:beta-N-acetylhexosaminidase
MNVNLAPVLDVYRQAGGFDDRYGRSYSSNPSVCARLGADFIAAQQRDGVAACAKHFPGLGAATLYQNTDLRPVTLNLSRTALATIDELPYHAAIAENVRLVMVSWAIYPALAPQLPAGLSSAIVQGQLRQALHFRGVTITDSLGAKALQPFGSTAERATRAAAADMDLILCALQSVNEGEQASDGLATAYANGQLDRTAFRAAVQRIVSLRLSLET